MKNKLKNDFTLQFETSDDKSDESSILKSKI